jgi:hypothetical protein
MVRTFKFNGKLVIISLHRPGAVKNLAALVTVGHMTVCNTPLLSVVVW